MSHVTLTLTAEQAEAVQAILALVSAPEAPAKVAEEPTAPAPAQERADERCGAQTQSGGSCRNRKPCRHHAGVSAPAPAPVTGKAVDVYLTRGRHADGSRKITVQSRNMLREAGVTALGKRSSRVAAERARKAGVKVRFVDLATGEPVS